MTICYIPRNYSIVTNALSCCLDLVAVIGPVESCLLTWIHEAEAVVSGDSWEQLQHMGSSCEHGFFVP